MAQNYVSPGWGSSADYAAAGLPWVFSGVAVSNTNALQFNFEYVSKQITVKNNATAGGGSICFGFTRNGTQLGPERYEVSPLEYITLDCRIKELFIIASGSATNVPFSLHASLTLIPEYNMPILTASVDGSNWDGVG